MEEDEENDKFDSYEFIKEYQQEYGEDMNIKDPKIIEGNIVDKKSQEYISEVYGNCKVFDLSNIRNNRENANKTLEILQNNDNVVLFQSTFLYKDIAIAKPDGFVKQNGRFYLIETKGTSSSKKIHLLDMIYQYHIVNYVLNEKFNVNIEKLQLCIVEYIKANKNQLPLTLTEYSQGVSINARNLEEGVIEEKQNKKMLTDGKHFTFLEIITNMIPDNINSLSRENLENYITPLISSSKFDEILNELNEYTINPNPQFQPCIQYNS
jgi:hypothetical protein